jgi:hypothetical protein
VLNLNPAINKKFRPIRGSEKLVSGCGVGFPGFYFSSGADAGFDKFRLRRVSSNPRSGMRPIFDPTKRVIVLQAYYALYVVQMCFKPVVVMQSWTWLCLRDCMRGFKYKCKGFAVLCGVATKNQHYFTCGV